MRMNKLGTPASQRILQTLIDHGYEAYYVGGAVRDFVRGTASADIDIATSATPQEVQKLFPRTVDVGIEFGTILVIIDGTPFEVTTFRNDALSGRPTLKEDLRRRDFTMNALAYTIDGTLIDYFEGEHDIHAQKIRAVDDPHARMMEDPLRILRACRFMATFQYEIEAGTLKAMQKEANRLQQVAPERMKQEMDRLLMGSHAKEALHLIVTSAIGNALPLFPKKLPMLAYMTPFTSSHEGWAYLCLAGDIHATVLAKAYVLSNEEKSFIQVVEHAFQRRTEDVFTIKDIYQFEADVLFIAEKLYKAYKGERTTCTVQYWQHQKQALPIQSKQELVVNGKDLLQWTNNQQGRWVGDWMTKIEQAVLHGECPNDEQVIKEWFIREFNIER